MYENVRAGHLANSIFHAEQAVEKLLKALLALEGHTGLFRSPVLEEFVKVFEDILPADTLQEVKELVPPVEQEWARSRYHIGAETGILFDPSTDYSLEDARDRQHRRERVFDLLLPVLRDRYNLQ